MHTRMCTYTHVHTHTLSFSLGGTTVNNLVHLLIDVYMCVYIHAYMYVCIIILQKYHILFTLFRTLLFIPNNMPFVFFHLSKDSSTFFFIKKMNRQYMNMIHYIKGTTEIVFQFLSQSVSPQRQPLLPVP